MDDDPHTLRYVRDILSDAGYAPLVTGDPDGLAGVIRAEKPRLVLIDLMLPGTDGIELMKRVPEFADLPVIFISGYGRDETIARALGERRGRLHRQAVLPDRVRGAGPGGAQEPGRARDLVHGELGVDCARSRPPSSTSSASSRSTGDGW